MTDAFSFFLPLSKIDKDKQQVSGYASTPALDLDGEIVSLDAIKKALPGYWEWRNIREMHQPSAIGVGKEANVDEKGLFLTSKITDPTAWQKVLDQVYKGYSIGGRKLAKSGNVITEIELIEVSLVDRPANPECKIEVSKRAKGEAPAHLLKFRTPRTVQAKALSKMAQVVDMLSNEVGKAGPPAAHDGFSLPATKAAMCKAHKVASCPDCTCSLHKTMDCTKCAMKAAKRARKIAKREVKAKERQSLASQGKALPDGSFPIKDKGDLANARQAIGRSKNPGAARALIRRRAAQLGVGLPDNWSKKLAKGLIAKAESDFLDLEKTQSGDWSLSAQSPFLTLGADERGGVWSGHELDSEQFLLMKGGAGAEGNEIGLNLEDLSMSKQNVADPLEKVLTELVKAGKGANPFAQIGAARANVKKARAMRKEAEVAIKAAHGMLKSAYLAKDALVKAGKKPAGDGDTDDMDTMGKAMSALNKAFGSVTSMKTFMKAVDVQLKKVGQAEQYPTTGNVHFEVPPGVKNMTMNDLVTAGPGGDERGSEPPILGMEQPFPGKLGKMLKGYVSPEVAKLMMEKAAAEAKVEVLEKQPIGPVHGRRPMSFDITKGGLAADPRSKDLFKNVDLSKIGRGNEAAHTSEVGKIIGNMILGGHGKPIFDPNFHGTAGGNPN